MTRPRPHHGGASKARKDRGSAAVELVLIAPVLMITLLLLIQWAVREQGQRAVNAAAREGAVAAGAWQAASGAGESAAARILESAGADLDDIFVSVDRGPTSATATISAKVPNLIPGVELSVTSTQSAPLEVFVP